MALGLLWTALGAFFFVNALNDELRIPTIFFVIPLLLDAALTLTAAFGSVGTRRMLRLGKCGLFVIISLLIVLKPGGSDIAIGILVGIILILDACWRVSSALVVRFARWRRSIALAVFEFALGLWAFVPWPTHWHGEVGMDVGTLIAITGTSLVGLALRLRRLPSRVPISRILSEGWPEESCPEKMDTPAGPPARGNLTVHVWTPTGALAPLTRGVERYIAATDRNGVISTGHAALEASPDIYISHYPAQEIDATPGDFAKALRATRENDQPGRWQPSYAIESGEWCASSFRIELTDINLEALRRFWSSYRLNPTYNLTNRNCSSAVAKALDIAVEGTFASASRSPRVLVRLLFQPELWTAGWLRYRAMAMAWTPGIVLDYSRALSAVLGLRGSSSPPRQP